MDNPFEKLLSDERIRLLAGLADSLSVDVWLLGGSLRDALMGRDVHDYDFALDSAEELLPREFASRIGGTFFWLDRERRQSRVVKREGDESFTFDFAPVRGGDILADLSLRDFTINSMAVPIDSSSGTLLDPLGGRFDIASGIVRVCSADVFDDDPLRLIRAVRFAVILQFRIEEDTRRQIHRKLGLLSRVAAERIRDEIFQILSAPGIGASLELLDDAGLLSKIIPLEGEAAHSIQCRIARASRVEARMDALERDFPRDWRHFSEHLQRHMEGGVSLLSLVKLAAFLFDEDIGGLANATCERLRLGNRAGKELKTILDCAGRFPIGHGMDMEDRVLYRFYRDRTPAGPELILVPFSERMVTLEQAERLVSFYFHGYRSSDQDLLLTGDQIKELLGIGPGPELGRYMEILREAESLARVADEAEAREFILKNRLTKQGPVG